MAERQDAGIAPDEIDRERQHRVADVFAEQSDQIGRDMKRRSGRHQQVENRDCDRERGEQHEKHCRRSVEQAREREGAHLGLHGSALEREHAPRTLLDEKNDQDENGNLAEHGACIWLEEFVGDPKRECADERAP